MVALGLLLLVLAVLVTLGVVPYNTDTSQAQFFGVTLADVSVGALFAAGVITGALGAIGLAMLFGGFARRRARRRAAKQQVTSVRTEASALAEENARLHEQLDRKRSTGDSHPAQHGDTAARGAQHGESGATRSGS